MLKKKYIICWEYQKGLTLIKKMPQSGVGSMRGSKERLHTRGGHTHNVTQRTETHIFTGGGRTHNVTQRTDTQIFFDTLTDRQSHILRQQTA